MVFRNTSWIGFFLSVVVLGMVSIPSVRADPPPPPPPMLIPPTVFCSRVTDIIEGEEDDDFIIMFESLNWTDIPAWGLYVAQTSLPGQPSLVMPRRYPTWTKTDGRPLDDVGDLAQFAAVPDADPPVGASPGQMNGWSGHFVGSFDSAILWSATDTPLGNRPLLTTTMPPPFGNDEMCMWVPGCHTEDIDHHPVIDDVESVDNGDPSVDGLPNNVLDGFVIEVRGWKRGTMLSLNWFFLDGNGHPIGVSGRPSGPSYAMGFGTFNIYRGPGGPPIWGRIPGTPEYQVMGGNDNVGTMQMLQCMFVTQSRGGEDFSVELGSALTANFLHFTDNAFPDGSPPAPISAHPLR